MILLSVIILIICVSIYYFMYIKKLKEYIQKLEQITSINQLAEHQYTWIENNHPHWHTKSTLECLALIASEVGEAVNEARGKEVTNNFKYELIDIILRTLDLAHQLDINVEEALKEKIELNLTRDFSNKVK